MAVALNSLHHYCNAQSEVRMSAPQEPLTSRRLPRHRFVCQPCRAAVSCLLSPAFGGDIEPILRTSLLAAFHHRTCHSRYRPPDSGDTVHPLSVGPQVEPWPFERARKAHLAIASHRQRHGTSNEFVVSRRSAGYRRASRSRLSPEPRPTNRCCPTRCSCQRSCSSGSNARRESSCRATACRITTCRATGCHATACNSGTSRRGRVAPRPRASRSLGPSPARRRQLHVRPLSSM
jgi:hypothetical protein